MRTRLLVVAALVSSLFACGTPTVAPDGGASGGGSGGGVGGGTGGGLGADAGSDLVVHLRGPTEPRRGPIPIEFDFNRPLDDAEGATMQLELLLDSGTWARVSALSVSVSRDVFLVVWDSFKDVSADGVRTLRVSLAGGPTFPPFTLDVRNDPNTPRLVLTAHPSLDLDGGGSAPRNDELSVLRWAAGAVVGAPARVKVGKGPAVLKASPNGMAVACLNDFENTVTVLKTPLDATVAGVSVLTTLTLPYGSPSDVEWSPDGQKLYVLGARGNDTTEPAALWRYFPLGDLSQFYNPIALATFDRPVMALSVEQPTGNLAVVLGSGGSAALGKLALRTPSGAVAAPDLDTDIGVPNDFAVSPAGGLALVTSDLFGNELIRYGLGAALTEETRHVPVKVPFGLVFHPASTATRHLVLVSNLNNNAVTPFVITPGSITPGTPATGLPLAAELDLIERGAETGTVFVSVLSSLGRVKFNADGTVTKLATAWDFGAGTKNVTGPIAVQR